MVHKTLHNLTEMHINKSLSRIEDREARAGSSRTTEKAFVQIRIKLRSCLPFHIPSSTSVYILQLTIKVNDVEKRLKRKFTLLRKHMEWPRDTNEITISSVF